MKYTYIGYVPKKFSIRKLFRWKKWGWGRKAREPGQKKGLIQEIPPSLTMDDLNFQKTKDKFHTIKVRITIEKV